MVTSRDTPPGESKRQHGHSIIGLIVTLMSGALISKVLGLVREVGMALIIGTAVVADSFRTAITAVLLPISFFQAETVPAVLIPMQQAEMRKGTAAQSLAALTIALALISILIMLGMQLAGSLLVDRMVAGFSEDEKNLTFKFVRIMALAMPASVMLNCLAAGEIALGRARISNARAAVQNLAVILGLGLVALGANVILLGWAFSLSFNGLAIWACWILSQEGNLSLKGVGPRKVLERAKEFFLRLRPFLQLPIAEQANIWIERFCTSRLQTGAIASLDYARTLTESFLLLISQPVGLAVLSKTALDRHESQAKVITRIVLAFAVPACAFLFVFAEEIVTIVFRRGAFGDTGVMLTSQALKGISIGLWASTLGWILLRLLNSASRNMRAAMVLVVAYGANMLFNATISGPMHFGEGPGIFLIGLGETTRSLVLLAGVILSIRNGYRLIPLILIAVVPAAGMVVSGLTIEHLIDGALPRVLAGGTAMVASMMLAIALLMPSAYSTGLGLAAKRWISWRTRGTHGA